MSFFVVQVDNRNSSASKRARTDGICVFLLSFYDVIFILYYFLFNEVRVVHMNGINNYFQRSLSYLINKV